MQTIPVLQLEDVAEDNPMPSRNHSRVQQNLCRTIEERYGEQWEVLPQLSLNLNGWETIPDIAIYPVGKLALDWRDDVDEVAAPPELVIEIVSPKQNLQPLVKKFDRYFEHGVKSCWQVLPMNRTVVVHSLDRAQEAFSKGVIKDPATGIEMAVDAVFASGAAA